ncbi:MAG: hypothetical protein MK234_04960 [Nitrospinales bacterium]|nr:hypothetical protein [Nitrospinales bacterium]
MTIPLGFHVEFGRFLKSIDEKASVDEKSSVDEQVLMSAIQVSKTSGSNSANKSNSEMSEEALDIDLSKS